MRVAGLGFRIPLGFGSRLRTLGCIQPLCIAPGSWKFKNKWVAFCSRDHAECSSSQGSDCLGLRVYSLADALACPQTVHEGLLGVVLTRGRPL